MATNLSLDTKLIKRAVEVSGERTKKAAVTRKLTLLTTDEDFVRAAAHCPLQVWSQDR